jgi:hypothetical protein
MECGCSFEVKYVVSPAGLYAEHDPVQTRQFIDGIGRHIEGPQHLAVIEDDSRRPKARVSTTKS